VLHVEASRTKVSQSGLKTGGVATQMVHVASLWRSRGDQVENERDDATSCVGLCYPYFVVFIVLDHKGILIFCLSL
jgi:hypothetical protein